MPDPVKVAEKQPEEAEKPETEETEETSTPDVKPEVKEPVESVDETGVPYKNRAAEYKRKYEELLEKPPVAETPKEEEDEWTKQQRILVRGELQRERLADLQMKSILDVLADNNPLVKRYRSKIEAEALRYTSDLRINPLSLKQIANSVIGDNALELVREQEKKEPPKPVKESLKSTPKEEVVETELTEDEKEYADRLRLWDRFDGQEIKAMYKKRQKELEKKK